MKIDTADTIGIWNDISDYLSITVDVMKMAIQILDHDRIATGGKIFSTHPTTHNYIGLTTPDTMSPCSSYSDGLPGFPWYAHGNHYNRKKGGKLESDTRHHLMQRRQLHSPSIIRTSKWLVASLGALVSNHTMESIARVFACRTLEYRLVLLGLPRYHEASVDGLPHWRELQSTGWD